MHRIDRQTRCCGRFADGVLSVEGVGADIGDCSVQVACEPLSDDIPAQASFQGLFLREALSAFDVETILLSLQDGMKPAVITAAADADHIQVLMPIFANDKKAATNRPVGVASA